MSPKTVAIIVMSIMLLSYLAIPVETVGEEGDGLAEWTFIVYLAAGNDLESAGIRDMNQMEMVGSDENVNIVILFDRIEGYDASEGDWTGTRIYHVQQDSDYGRFGEYTEGVNVWNSTEEVDLNMGDPNTLINFTTWAIDNFPAKKYALDLWNHGAGFWGICWDDAYEDALNMSELSYALREITSHLGRRIDLVGFDACLMAQTAVMYEIKDYADIGVGSGLVEPGPGWPYHRINQVLADNPTMSARDLGKAIVDEYVDSYTGGDEEEDPDHNLMATMAAFDLAAFENTAEAINRFGMAMAMGPINEPGGAFRAATYYGQLKAIRSRTACYDLVSAGPFNYHYCLYDVIDLANRVERNPALSFLHGYAQDVIVAVNDAMYYSRTNDFRVNHHGLTLYFPSGTQTTYDSRFDATRFAQEKYWDSFLLNYASMTLVSDTPPSITISYPLGAQNISPSEGTVTMVGTAFDMQESIKYVEVKIGEDGDWVQAEGAEDWSYSFDAARHGGDLTIYARSYDGSEYSPEVGRVVYIRDVASMPTASVQEGGFPWAVVIVPLLALIAVAAIRKNKMRTQ